MKHELFVDMRYRGQSYELEVALTPRFAADFHAAHRRTFGHSAPGAAIEAVNLRLRSSAAGPPISPHKVARTRKAPAPLSRIETLVGAAVKRVPVYSRDAIGAGVTMTGPLIVVELSSTAYVAPEFSIRADDFGNLHLELR
jgi:N-methylhydantoinase A